MAITTSLACGSCGSPLMVYLSKAQMAATFEGLGSVEEAKKSDIWEREHGEIELSKRVAKEFHIGFVDGTIKKPRCPECKSPVDVQGALQHMGSGWWEKSEDEKRKVLVELAESYLDYALALVRKTQEVLREALGIGADVHPNNLDRPLTADRDRDRLTCLARNVWAAEMHLSDRYGTQGFSPAQKRPSEKARP